MDRKEVCAKIRELNLQDAVKQHFGDNYTRVSTDKLESLIKAYQPASKAPKPTETKPETKPEPVVKQDAELGKAVACTKVDVTTDNPFEAACLAFLYILDDAGLLDELLDKME